MQKNVKSILGLMALVCFSELLNAKLASVETSQSFSCSVNKSSSVQIYWQIKRANEESRILFLCDNTEAPNCAPLSIDYLELYEANSDTQSAQFTSVFSIKSVSPSDSSTDWNCMSDTGSGISLVTSYNFIVYGKPETPKCENITLLNDKFIQIKCVTQKVFPTARCVFYLITNNTNVFELKNGSVIYKNGSSTFPQYRTTECNYSVSAGLVGPGSHVFYVVMYPDITSDITNNMKEKSNLTNIIQIGYPKALLDYNCQLKGYIKENETIDCTCYDGNINFLPSRIKWSEGKSNNATITFTAKRLSEAIQSFKCIISNALNWTNKIIYLPNVSYPPLFRNMTLNSRERDICDEQTANITGSCSVAGSNPDPNVYIAINRSMIQLKFESEKNEFTFNVPVASTGIFNVACYANNSEFGNLYGGASSFLTIKGPPSPPKIIRLEDKDTSQPSKNVLQVTEKQTTILCQSTGGYPIYKNISLKCGERKNQTTTDEKLTLTLNITTEMRKLSCMCIVWHELNCFQNNATLEFKCNDKEPSFGSKYGPDSNIIGIAAGSSIGMFVITFIVVIGFMKTRFDHLRYFPSNKKEKIVNNTDLYFIEKEIIMLNMKLPEYFNIVTTMKSATEVPKNLKH